MFPAGMHWQKIQHLSKVRWCSQMPTDTQLPSFNLYTTGLFCMQVTADTFFCSQLAHNQCSHLSADGTQIFLCPLNLNTVPFWSLWQATLCVTCLPKFWFWHIWENSHWFWISDVILLPVPSQTYFIFNFQKLNLLDSAVRNKFWLHMYVNCSILCR